MIILGEAVTEYIKSKKILLDSFDCYEDYFIKNLEQCNWTISTDGEWYIASFWETTNNKQKKTDVVIVKKDGKPQIFESNEYTMVIGIQCVKIAFIFNNKKRIC